MPFRFLPRQIPTVVFALLLALVLTDPAVGQPRTTSYRLQVTKTPFSYAFTPQTEERRSFVSTLLTQLNQRLTS